MSGCGALQAIRVRADAEPRALPDVLLAKAADGGFELVIYPQGCPDGHRLSPADALAHAAELSLFVRLAGQPGESFDAVRAVTGPLLTAHPGGEAMPSPSPSERGE